MNSGNPLLRDISAKEFRSQVVDNCSHPDQSFVSLSQKLPIITVTIIKRAQAFVTTMASPATTRGGLNGVTGFPIP